MAEWLRGIVLVERRPHTDTTMPFELFNQPFMWILIQLAVGTLQFCIMYPYNPFPEVMVPVPQYNSGICSGSTCNTRQKQAK